jgi:hypothetical protein
MIATLSAWLRNAASLLALRAVGSAAFLITYVAAKRLGHLIGLPRVLSMQPTGYADGVLGEEGPRAMREAVLDDTGAEGGIALIRRARSSGEGSRAVFVRSRPSTRGVWTQ